MPSLHASVTSSPLSPPATVVYIVAMYDATATDPTAHGTTTSHARHPHWLRSVAGRGTVVETGVVAPVMPVCGRTQMDNSEVQMCC